MLVLDIAYMIYLKFEEYPNALQIALFLDNMQVCTLLRIKCAVFNTSFPDYTIVNYVSMCVWGRREGEEGCSCAFIW
jgi:hypothetical protein